MGRLLTNVWSCKTPYLNFVHKTTFINFYWGGGGDESLPVYFEWPQKLIMSFVQFDPPTFASTLASALAFSTALISFFFSFFSFFFCSNASLFSFFAALAAWRSQIGNKGGGGQIGKFMKQKKIP